MRWTLIDLIRRERHSKTRGPTHYPTTRTGWLLFLCNIASVSSTKTCVTEFPTVKQRVTDKCLFSRYHDSLPVTHTHTLTLYLHIWWWCAGGRVWTWSRSLCGCEHGPVHPWSCPSWSTLWQPYKEGKKNSLKVCEQDQIFFSPSQHHIFHSKRFSTTRALTL